MIQPKAWIDYSLPRWLADTKKIQAACRPQQHTAQSKWMKIESGLAWPINNNLRGNEAYATFGMHKL